jgi:hypothetical protein
MPAFFPRALFCVSLLLHAVENVLALSAPARDLVVARVHVDAFTHVTT